MEDEVAASKLPDNPKKGTLWNLRLRVIATLMARQA